MAGAAGAESPRHLPPHSGPGAHGVLRQAAGVQRGAAGRPPAGAPGSPGQPPGKPGPSLKILRQAMNVAGAHRSPRHHRDATSPDRGGDGGKDTRVHAKLYYREPVLMKDESGKPLKLEDGEKNPFSDADVREFGADYAQGMNVYVYEGDVLGGDKRDGTGHYTYAGGEKYEGPWRNNKRQGPDGSLVMTTGHRYEGDWADDLMDGTGREEFAKGEVYLGDYAKGRMHGTGGLEYVTTGTKYTGQWSEGRKHGQGKMEYANGDVFEMKGVEGRWVNGRREGKGQTTYANGRVYESNWKDGRLVGAMHFAGALDAAGRVAAPPPSSADFRKRRKLNKQTLMPVDLTRWQPKPETRELPTEHFMRLQLAFEKLDAQATGDLSMQELERLWPKGDRKAFAQLDRDRNGFVSLYEIYRAWYPSVPKRDVEKYLATYITPQELLRHRGELCGVTATGTKGFVQLSSPATEMTRDQLKRAKNHVGGERLSENQFTKSNARTDKETVSFKDLLDVWYPNVPAESVERYELTYIPEDEMDAVRNVFEAVASDGVLHIDDFDRAQQRWQLWLVDAGPDAPPTTPFYDVESTPQDDLHRIMTEGVFREQPFWPMGPITVTLKMLQDIDVTQGGWVTISDLLCFNYPNVECLWTQLKWLDRHPPIQECECDIHVLTGDSVLAQLGM